MKTRLTYDQCYQLYKSGVFYYKYVRKYLSKETFYEYLYEFSQEEPARVEEYVVLRRDGGTLETTIITNKSRYTLVSRGRSIERVLSDRIKFMRYHEFCIACILGTYNGEEYCLNY